MSREILERIGQLSQALTELQDQVEKALEKSDASRRYLDFVRASTDWSWETDANLNYTYASEGIAAVFGSPNLVMEGRYLFALDHFRDIDERLLALVDSIQDHQSFRDVAIDVVDRAGDAHRILLSGVPVFDDESGRFDGYRGTGTDITGRPAVVAATLGADPDAALYRQAVESARLGIWSWNPKTGALGVSPGLEAALGYAAGEFPGTIEAWTDHIHRDDRDRVRLAMDEHIRRDAPGYEIEHRIVTAAGEVRWFLARGHAEWDPTGAVVRVTVVLADVTPIKWREADLSEALAQANAAERTRGEFLAQLSHELRTPLNAIIGFSEAIKEGYLGPLSSEKSQEYASDVFAASSHLLEIINDVLDLSRIDAGGLELHDEEVDVRDLVEGSVRLVEGRAATGLVELTIEVAPNLPGLRADPRLAKQTLLNLLTTAVKVPDQGGAVTITAARRGDGGIEITIADTGIGIRAEDIQRALEPFIQVGDDIGRRDEGSGLGLPLARSIMELHGGSLELRSEVGRGTQAIVVFPPHRSIA